MNYTKPISQIIASLLILFLLSSCTESPEKKPEISSPYYITVSKDADGTFQSWFSDIKASSDSLVFINMYETFATDSFDYWLNKSDGIIISGGEDVNPALYGQAQDTVRCGPIDQLRDSLELLMINFAYNNQIPLLGICRGHQIMNVAFGGSLIVDIPQDYGTKDMHRKNGGTRHKVTLTIGSFLSSFIRTDNGRVYSNHHQAIHRVAEGFKISAFAPDGIAESIEPEDTTKHPFILGVQWHPEAMNHDHSLSGRIAEKFLEKVKTTSAQETTE